MGNQRDILFVLDWIYYFDTGYMEKEMSTIGPFPSTEITPHADRTRTASYVVRQIALPHRHVPHVDMCEWNVTMRESYLPYEVTQCVPCVT